MILRVQITMLPYGRRNPITIGYRPHLVNGEGQGDFFIRDIVGDKKTIFPGESFEGIIELINPKFFETIIVGTGFQIYEGKRIVGTGKIIQKIQNNG